MSSTIHESQATSGRVVELGRPWRGVGPFLFASHHLDAYPQGNGAMGPDADLSDRPLGQDMRNPSGWSMYHGTEVPGFPAHPHRGFETITIVRKGYVDHADSTGASARYGPGDVQWVTAGRGVSHSEMFPLVRDDAPNPFEIYQIWLNLPALSKGAAPEFTMQWAEDIPVVESGGARVHVIAGSYGGAAALDAPRASWAADAASDTAVWLIDLEPGASVELPAATLPEAVRMVYVHGEGGVEIDGEQVPTGFGYEQDDVAPVTVTAGDRPAVLLVLQSVDLGEPIAQYGPFVMNTEAEIRQAFLDYQRTEFGGWEWDSTAPVHPKDETRFARHGDGRLERPGA
ncbi:pirin family protein [Nocardioides sp. GXZ039]|uniref:pirin family protein n=1 Tax=Nocardioides sp. GXZ039 TaxID=3136018 RepID=UPI0030F396A5